MKDRVTVRLKKRQMYAVAALMLLTVAAAYVVYHSGSAASSGDLLQGQGGRNRVMAIMTTGKTEIQDTALHSSAGL